jgi:hypothetical protein
MSSSVERGQRIQANCKIIWGDGDYDLDNQTDDHLNWQCLVQRDLGLSYEPLTMTALCNSPERAWRELDRMLGAWARQVQSGLPMTKAKELEIFSGPGGRHRYVLEQFLNELERRGG